MYRLLWKEITQFANKFNATSINARNAELYYF